MERAHGLQCREELLFCNNLLAFKHFFTCSFLAVIFLFFLQKIIIALNSSGC